MTVVFFISGHGFGHASREVEIINALIRIAPDARVIVRSAVSPSLLERSIVGPYELRPGLCDSGIVQTTSVGHDDDATTAAAIDYYSGFEQHIADEAAALRDVGVDVIVGDIPPLAFEVAARLGVPSVAIANFTWDWIYETHPGLTQAAPWLVPRIREAYARATIALELPLCAPMEAFRARRPLPLVARHAARDRGESRAHFGVAPNARAALLSFGGYGMPGLDLGGVDCADWTLVVTDRVIRPGQSLPHNVVQLEEQQFLRSGFRYEDLVNAVDAVVTKPGYGIIAECIANGTAMLYTSRGTFREYDILVREMPRYLRCRFIDQPALFAGRWRDALDALLAQPPPPETIATNGAEVAARAILSS